MADGWFYAHDIDRMGPFTSRQLRTLADAGTVLPTDMVWKEGVEKGAQASRIKNLFPPAHANPPQVSVNVPLEATIPTAGNSPALIEPASSQATAAPPTPDAPAVQPVAAPAPPPRTVRKGRAIALKGADIVSQDGIKAKYRKKCIICAHKDTAYHSISISNKTTKAGYYCPKCRKKCEVVIQCQAG